MSCNGHVISCNVHICNGHVMLVMACNYMLGVSLKAQPADAPAEYKLHDRGLRSELRKLSAAHNGALPPSPLRGRSRHVNRNQRRPRTRSRRIDGRARRPAPGGAGRRRPACFAFTKAAPRGSAPRRLAGLCTDNAAEGLRRARPHAPPALHPAPVVMDKAHGLRAVPSTAYRPGGAGQVQAGSATTAAEPGSLRQRSGREAAGDVAQPPQRRKRPGRRQRATAA
jgi:hypothetical protein